MLVHIVDAKYVDGYRIEVLFNDGRKGVADLGETLKGPNDLVFDGTDTFTYTASDGTSTSLPVTITITVTKPSRFPKKFWKKLFSVSDVVSASLLRNIASTWRGSVQARTALPASPTTSSSSASPWRSGTGRS